MDLSTINSMLDADTLSQQSIFTHPVEDYKVILETLRECDTEDENYANLKTKALGSNKPYAEFIKAIAEIREDNNKDIAIRSLMDKSFKIQKYDYTLLFCDSALSFNPQYRYALDLKAQVLKKTNADKEDQKKAIEAYLAQDLFDTHFLLELAEIHLGENKKEEAILDVKKAIQRAIHKPDFQELKVCALRFDKIMAEQEETENQERIYFLIPTLVRAGKTIPTDKIINILTELEKRNSENTPYSIEILKEILKLDSSNTKARTSLVEQYRKKYENSERSISCMEASGLTKEDGVKASIAIENFEKLVRLDKGTFVYHAIYGLGRISEVDNKKIIINFIDKMNHKMSVDMALKSLSILEKNHILVLKAFANRKQLHDKFTSDSRWGLETLIKSGVNTFKLMKNELVPSVLKADEFLKFQQNAKEIIKSDKYISAVISKNDEFEVRSTPITFEEKLFREFRNQTNIYLKIKTTRDFLRQEGDLSSDSFQNMMTQMCQYMKTRELNDNSLAAHLFIAELSRSRYKIDNIKEAATVKDKALFSSIPKEKYLSFYLGIQDTELRKDYVDLFKKYDENWNESLTSFFTKLPISYISRIFKDKGVNDFDENMKKRAVFIRTQSPELFLYYYKEASDYQSWSTICGTEYEYLSTQLDIVRAFPKLQCSKTILVNLVPSLEKFIGKNNDASVLTPLYFAIDSNSGIDDMSKAKLKHQIKDIVPEIDSSKEEDFPKHLLCLQSTYYKKLQELDDLVNIEIPNNAKEISKARELGDLRENAEFQYAKDKQKNLNATMKNLQKEINRAKIVKPEDVDPAKVGFGCEVTIEYGDGKKESYKILGPWESDAANNCISFDSPLGRELYNHEKGEKLSFTVNETKYDITVKKIEKAI